MCDKGAVRIKMLCSHLVFGHHADFRVPRRVFDGIAAVYIHCRADNLMEDNMNRSLRARPFILIALFPAILYAGEVGAPVQIDPSIQDYQHIFAHKLTKKFVVGDVVDKRKNAGSDTVGETRTGRFTMSALLCNPLPSAILQRSLGGMFRELDALAEDKKSADFQIDAEMLELTVEETNKVFSQQIKARIKFRVKVRAAASGALVNQFVIRAENSRSALNTTPFAATVARNAMVSGLHDLLESLLTL